MALLSTFWDVLRTRTLDAAGAPLALTYAHSVGQAPDLILPVLKSVGRHSHTPALFCEGANASLATVGVMYPSVANASIPVVAFDLYVAYIYSTGR